MAKDFNDLASLTTKTDWRRRGMGAAVLLAALCIGGFFLWDTQLKGESSSAPKTTTQAVTRGTIRQTVATTGTVAAESSTSLSFQTTGRVTSVNVKLGEQVKQGDVLAEVDTTDLKSALATAQANLRSAQIKLRQLQKPATAADLAAADQAVAQAQATYDKANNDLSTLTGPPSASDLAAAQQAVSAAESQLQQAQNNLDSLTQGASVADIAAAQAAVASAQAALSAAQNAVTNAQNSVTSAQATLFSAETAYCAVDSSMAFCTTRAAPISGADRSALLGVTQTPVASGTPTAGSAPSLAASVLTADGGYTTATNALANANGNVTSAQSALASAQAKLAALQAGASSDDVAAAQAAVNAAQAALDSANEKLALLTGGPTAADLSAAQGAVNSAQAALTAAQAKRDDVEQGATSDDIDLQETAVQLAQISVDTASNNLKKAQIVAPFDGTVAALNVQVGDMAGASGSTSSAAAGAAGAAGGGAPIVLDTPDVVRLDLTLGETDVSQVHVGDRGIALFDGLPGVIYPFVVQSIGGTPSVTQGVVTYTAQATLSAGIATAAPGGASGPGGTSSPGGASAPGGASNPGETRAQLRNAAPTPVPQPKPGMNANATIQVGQASNVLLVPQTALRRQGTQTVVLVQRANGATETVAITVGFADNNNAEVTSGLKEGDKVVLPAAIGPATNASSSGAGGGLAPPDNGVPQGVR